MKTAVIIQARMGSTRLPGKVMRPLLGRPMVHYVVERVAKIPCIDELIVATPESRTERPLVQYLDGLDCVTVSRGPEADVLARYYQAAKAVRADVVVRITSDCPLISPAVSTRVVGTFLEHAGEYDYVSNTIKRSYPRGLDTEVFSFAALETAYKEAEQPEHREHVTNFIVSQPEVFNLLDVVGDEDLSGHRWTVDTPEDFELVTRIYKELYRKTPEFEWTDVLKLLDKHPDWVEINRNIGQKRVT